MISIEYIIAFAMSITNLFKDRIPTAFIPFVSFALSIILNLINAKVFHGDLLLAGKEAFCDAGIAIGIFNIGSITRKLIDGDNPLTKTTHKNQS